MCLLFNLAETGRTVLGKWDTPKMTFGKTKKVLCIMYFHTSDQLSIFLIFSGIMLKTTARKYFLV